MGDRGTGAPEKGGVVTLQKKEKNSLSAAVVGPDCVGIYKKSSQQLFKMLEVMKGKKSHQKIRQKKTWEVRGERCGEEF